MNHITKGYGDRTLLDRVSLTVHSGERLALVGRNGVGKSTLLNIVAGLSTPDDGRVVLRSDTVIGYLHQEVDPLSRRTVLAETLEGAETTAALSRRIKELQSAITSATDEATVQELTRKLGNLQHHFEMLGGYRLEAEAGRILLGLGFSISQLDEEVASFSGGWLMRMALARILLRNPDLLLLDEPSNHLDLQSLLWFEDLLRQFSGAVIFISHDRAFVNRVATRVSELSDGHLEHFTGNYDAYLLEKEKRLELLRATRANQEKQLAETRRFVERFRAKATKARQVQSRIKQLEKVEVVEGPRQEANIAFQFALTERCGKEVLRAEDVAKSYGSHTVYEGLNLTLHRGDKVALVGDNGAGKSTLLKLMAGVVEADSGTFSLGDRVNRAYFAQHQVEALQPARTALEELARQAPGESEGRLRDLLGVFLFRGDDVHRKIEVMSGGEKTRVALACLLVRPANLLLLDEPTNHLDIPARDVLEGALARYDGTFCLITHDRHLIRAVANRILEVGGGTVRPYPMDYDAYLYRKDMEEARLQENSAETGRPPLAPLPEDIRQGKSRRQALGGLRSDFYRQTRQLKTDIEGAEDQLEGLLRRKKEIEDDLTRPEVYSNGGLVAELKAELSSLEERSQGVTADWETLSMKLEEMETRFREQEEELRNRG